MYFLQLKDRLDPERLTSAQGHVEIYARIGINILSAIRRVYSFTNTTSRNYEETFQVRAIFSSVYFLLDLKNALES